MTNELSVCIYKYRCPLGEVSPDNLFCRLYDSWLGSAWDSSHVLMVGSAQLERRICPDPWHGWSFPAKEGLGMEHALPTNEQ